jgi:predicted nucleic acid-binding protein
MRLVFNSTPLIYLAKVGLLPLLKDVPGEKLIPESVKIEVVDKGKERAAKDALTIERAPRWHT